MLDRSLLTLKEGDCRELLKEIPDQSIDLVFTSPPYAEQRKTEYKGCSETEYIEWFTPIGTEIKRVLKPTGSFFLNIKPHCDKGERSLYVSKLIIALREQIGFRYIDEYVWYKSASPRKRTFRLKNCWEPIYHFAVGSKPYINHNEIQIRSDSTFGDKRGWTSLNELTRNLGGYHDICTPTLGWTDPDNVLYFPTSLLVKDKYSHPAKFPFELAHFFVRGFCPPDGIVCDPFSGSGITALASLVLNRKCVAIELEKRFCEMILNRISSYEKPLISDKDDRMCDDVDIFENQHHNSLNTVRHPSYIGNSLLPNREHRE